MIKLVKVCRVFENNIIALKNFNYEFKNKGFYVIVGPSGSGKSTLLNILACLDNEYKGSVYYNNKKLRTKRKNKVRKHIGMIYQSPNLIPYLNVQENISLNPKTINKELIEQLGINKLMKRDIKKLSGGQSQRVSLARALSYDPRIILADEPTAALDLNNAHKVMKILKHQSNNKLVIMVSHDLSLIKQYADRILYLSQGKLEKEEIIKDIEDNNSNLKSKKRKKSFLRLVFKFLKYKKKSVFLTSLCFVIGLLGVILSLILSEGFINFFQKQFDNSLNSNVIYGYPKANDKIKTISMIDAQNIAISNNLKWHQFYRYNDDINNEVLVNNVSIDWLSIYNLFSYTLNEEIEKIDINSFVLIFPLNYSFIFSSLFNQNIENEYQINEYLSNNEIIFHFNFSNYQLKLKLDHIKWTLNNKIEIIHSSRFFLEELSNTYNFKISDEMESNNLIRYPYLIDVDENKQEFLSSSEKYKNVMFDFDNEYNNNKITLMYYALSPRINKNELERYLIYDNVLDYLYISQNGVCIEQNIPSLKFNEIEGKNISFYPISLDEDYINKQFLLYGNIPKNSKEVIVSYKLFKALNIKINQSVNVKHELGNFTQIKIVGYIEGNDSYFIYQQGNWSYYFFVNELKIKVSELPCYQISLIFENKNTIPYYVSFFNGLEENIEFVSPLFEANKEINKIINYFKFGILILSGFSVFVSILLIAVIIFINTIGQKKYDAILIMQGYSINNIIFLHLLQSIVISMISFVFTLFISVFIVAEVNIIFSLMLGVSYYSFANLSVSLSIKIFIYSLLIAIIFSIVPLKLLNLGSPLKVLKE